MDALLALDEAPDELSRPQGCFEARPWQWWGDGREPRPLGPEHPARCDADDSRHGTGPLVMRGEPVPGWRQGTVTPRRTTRAFAHGLRERVDVHLPEAAKRRVGRDHRSPHTPGALDDVFAPADARRLLRQLAGQLTPAPGRWLNLAALELAVLARPCVSRRLPPTARMIRESSAWQARRHRGQAVIDGRWTTADARLTLTRLSPKERL